jgi:hypothetical protein
MTTAIGDCWLGGWLGVWLGMSGSKKVWRGSKGGTLLCRKSDSGGNRWLAEITAQRR